MVRKPILDKHTVLTNLYVLAILFSSTIQNCFATPNQAPQTRPSKAIDITSLAKEAEDPNSIELEAKKRLPLELVAQVQDMPRGITVSHTGRIFICFPRLLDNPVATVAELKNGQAVAYPNLEINRPDREQPSQHLLSVSSAAIDGNDRLWILDTGRINRKIISGGAKLIGIDTTNNQIIKTIEFPATVVLPTTFLKDICVDLRKGKDGIAYISDASPKGNAAIITVDLATGHSSRHLNQHYSVIAEPYFVIFAEGRMVRLRFSQSEPQDVIAGVSGLALSSDGSTLYYSPLASRELYSVSTSALLNDKLSEIAVEKTVKSLGTKASASDGLESDSTNNLYLADIENNAIWKRSPNGTATKIARDNRLLWPDRLWLADDGYLYITASQFHRHPICHYGEDQRKRPFEIFKIKVDAKPIPSI